MTKKISLPLKISGSKGHVCNWTLNQFPKNYDDLNYIELFINDGSIILNKNISKSYEIINGSKDIISIFQAIRDEPKELISRLKKKKFNQNVFEKSINQTIHEDYLDLAVNEYISRKMSKGGAKKTFIAKELEWNEEVVQIPIISQRLKKTFLFDKPYQEILKAFNVNDNSTLCYVNAESNKDWDEQQHILLASSLKEFKGKVIVSHKTCPLYKKLYKSWKKTEKKLTLGGESIWTNY